jgi:tetratricopeptide (TPR) repeat protein/tRNA A-37 threonylcarbamoyl transferase component Bud32
MSETPEKTRPVPKHAPDPRTYLAGQRVERYEVGERLGAGGMGEVYRAWDPLLKRAVALKRVADDKLGDAHGRERLLHEARALSALSHPAIASVYDVVEAHGQLFIVEEFVSGTSLRERLREPIELDAFFPIADGCLSALDEASRRGIVHCDIKPENIVLTEEGQPKILDFGLARRAAHETGERSVATRVKASSEEPRGGTTSYMAPEALVESRADARSDLWALGVVFYEMLTGRHPFRRASAAETATSILTEHPPEPSRLRHAVPRELDDVVMSMLAKNPEERAGSAELLAAVRGQGGVPVPVRPARRTQRRARRIAVAAASVVVAAAAWAAWEWTPIGGAPGLPVYLAVEPFDSPGVDPHVEFFAQGLVEAAVERLSGVHRLVVVAPDVPFRVDGKLRGNVQLVVDRLRVSYEVRGPGDAASAGVLQGSAGEIFDLRDRLASDVSRILADRFGLEAPAPEDEQPPETSPAAYAAYLHGAGYLSRASEPDRAATAVQFFEKALAADPTFVPARIGLADALWRSANGDAARSARAREVSREAIEAAPDRVDGHRVRGRILLEAGEVEEASQEFARALALDPSDEEASRLLAQAELRLERPDEAAATLSRAAAARPDDWVLQRNLGMHLYQHGRLEEALVVCKRMVALTPGNARGKSTLGAICFYLGRNEEAIDAYLESIAIEPNHRAFSNIATVYMAERRFEEAATNFEAALALDAGDYRVWGNLVAAYENMPGKESELAAALGRAVELAEARLRAAPDDATALSLASAYYAAAGRGDDARRAIERAVALAPSDMDVLFHAAGTLERLGDRQGALEAAERALEAGFPVRMMEREPKLQELVASAEFGAIARAASGPRREGT